MKEAPADVAAAPVQAAKPVSAVDDLLNLDMMGAPAPQQPAQQSFDPWRNSGKKTSKSKTPYFVNLSLSSQRPICSHNLQACCCHRPFCSKRF